MERRIYWKYRLFLVKTSTKWFIVSFGACFINFVLDTVLLLHKLFYMVHQYGKRRYNYQSVTDDSFFPHICPRYALDETVEMCLAFLIRSTCPLAFSGANFSFAIYSKIWSNSRIALGLTFTLYLSKMFFLQFCKNIFCVNYFCSINNFLLWFENSLINAIHSCKFII